MANLRVQALTERFNALVTPLRDDRNANRAHRYERRGTPAKMLDFEDVGRLFDELESLLNDMRLVCSGTTTPYTDMNVWDVDTTARDLTDLLLFGGAYRLSAARENAPAGAHWMETREKFYAWVHQRHEAGDGSGAFNDAAF